MTQSETASPMRLRDRVAKRTLDVAVSLVGSITLLWLMALAWIVASIDTRQNGLFIQTRVGRDGRPFPLLKIRTMRNVAGWTSTVTTGRDPRITTVGRLLRRTKLDELPQLLNVLVGHMSLVGPRPDMPGFADRLQGADRVVLSLRPGITGPATLRFRDEEALLAAQPDPERYNREVIWPEKVRLNRQYAERYAFRADLVFILRTLVPRAAPMPSGVAGK